MWSEINVKYTKINVALLCWLLSLIGFFLYIKLKWSRPKDGYVYTSLLLGENIMSAICIWEVITASWNLRCSLDLGSSRHSDAVGCMNGLVPSLHTCVVLLVWHVFQWLPMPKSGSSDLKEVGLQLWDSDLP